MKLVFASNNAHKLSEVRDIMPAGVEVLSLKDIGFEQEIEENGTTLEENSLIKAEAVYHWILDNGHWTIDGVFADDTGLEIDALGGKPGVYTARWYLTDEGMKGLKDERDVFAANRKKALAELQGKTNRNAQFRTVITLAFSNRCAKVYNRQIFGDPNYIQVEGIVRGQIAKEEYGEGGFGYDPVFIPEGYDKTFGELPAEVKNGISHRARALAELVKVLNR
jgi:XTP/dITP diphosphohydrolase